MNKFDDWFIRRYGKDNLLAERECKYLNKKGWLGCKKAVLEILKQPIQNCDLSWEEVDKRFILVGAENPRFSNLGMNATPSTLTLLNAARNILRVGMDSFSNAS